MIRGDRQQRSHKLRPKFASFQMQGVSADRQVTFWVAVLEICLLVQGGRLLFTPQLATLQCDRPQPNLGICKLVRSGLLGETTTPFPLDQLQKAETRIRGKSRQLVLHLSDERLHFPINWGFSSTEVKAAQVNAFLQDSATKSLSVQQDNRWIAYPFGVMLAGVGGCLLGFRVSSLLKRSTSS